jgi:hypothetical protein
VAEWFKAPVLKYAHMLSSWCRSVGPSLISLTRENDDELTLQLLGIRLFNAAAASIKLALSGYYQKAFDQVRDVIETGFLIDYLISHPSEIAGWRSADKKVRMNRFSPAAIRRALDTRDGYTGERRKAIYDLISEAASHASYKGFALVANTTTNLGEIGPFFDEKKLAAWLQELAKHIAVFAAILVPTQGQDLRLLNAQVHYLKVWQDWKSKYLPDASGSGSRAVEPSSPGTDGMGI